MVSNYYQGAATTRAIHGAPGQAEHRHLEQINPTYSEALADYDMTNYEGAAILLERDRRLIDQFLSEDEGLRTFQHQDAGYSIMADGETARARCELAARQGKDVAEISIAKNLRNGGEMHYHMYFKLARLHPQERTPNNGRLMIHEQKNHRYVMTGARVYDEQRKQPGRSRDATLQEAQNYAEQLISRADQLKVQGQNEEAQRLLAQERAMRIYYLGNM